MKRKTGIYNEIYGRKWRLIFIALVLIFLVISVSATGKESGTDSQASDKILHKSNIGVSNETEGNCSYCTESGKENGNGYEYSYCTENEDKGNTKDECSYCIESEEKSLEQKVGKTKSTETQKTVEQDNKSQTGKKTKTQKTVVEDNKSKTGTGKNTKTQKTVTENNKSKTETGKNTKTQKTVTENNKSQTGTEKNTKTQNTVVKDNKSQTGTEKNTKTQKIVAEDNKSQTGTGKSAKTQKTVVEDNQSQTGTGKNTTQETVEDTEQETYLYNSILYFKVHKIGENKTTETQETVEEDNETGAGKNTKTQETVEENNESETGTGKNTTQETVEEDNKSQKGTGKNTTQETVEEDNESQKGTGKNITTQKIVEENNESETGTGKNTTQETVEENNESQTRAGKNTTQETVEEDNESQKGTGKNTKTQKTVEGTEQEIYLYDSLLNSNVYKIGENKTTETQETVEEDNETGAGKNTKTQKIVEENNESETGTGKNTKTQETVEENNESETGAGKNTKTQKIVEENNESETGTGKNTKTQETVEEDNKSQTGTGKNTTQETVEENNESQTETGKNTTTQKTNAKKSDSNSSESDGSNWKSKIKIVNRTATQKSAGTKTETKTEVGNGSNSVESKVVEPEVIVYSWTKSLESQEIKTEIKVYNWTDSQGNKSVPPEIKTEKNSWNNMKLILSYSYPLRSFYAADENVNLSYNGPRALGQQNVDIYLIKENSPNSPENGVSYGMNNSMISLEDVLNNNTEAYVQIPATLNKEGDLTPLTLDPLQAGSYWVLITLAGNETGKPESEKGVIFAKYFEVLKYQIEASAPYALQEGENLEVNLDLKNAPAEKNCTYWAVLIKDDAYTASEGTNPSWRMTTGVRPIVKGVDLIRSLENSLKGYDSENKKDEIKNEIQTLIGEDNGTISIGEKNQSSLSLKSLELPPGDYLLLTGAYENKEGLEGIAQKKLRISAENLHGLGLKSSSGNTLGDSSSMKFKASPLEDLKPYIQANSLVEVLRNPPKLPSFLLGFAVTLLIGLAVLRKKK